MAGLIGLTRGVVACVFKTFTSTLPTSPPLLIWQLHAIERLCIIFNQLIDWQENGSPNGSCHVVTIDD